MDEKLARSGIETFLSGLGYDLGRPELADTPERVVKAFVEELLSGEGSDLGRLVLEGSEPAPSREQGLVVLRNVSLATLCPHHLMPALGTAAVAYLPGARLLGLGTLARLVDASARRLTLQEAIGERVVDALMQDAGARGAFCEIDLGHGCLAARGARKEQARFVTVARRGALAGADALGELSLALGRAVPEGGPAREAP
jgi:GTP cyclohydrolase IA